MYSPQTKSMKLNFTVFNSIFCIKTYLFIVAFLISISSFAQMSELIISEYAEGSSYNKYVEIYNGTGSTVDLSQYQIWRISNGGSWPEASIPLTGNLVSGGVFVVCHTSANATIQAKADILSGTLSHNGDDAIGLAKNSVLIDAVGEDGADPGTGWAVAGVSNATVDHVLIRKNTVCSPNTNWTTSSANEWIVESNENWSDLGTHTANCGGGPLLALPTFNPATGTYYSPLNIELTTTATGASIYYTLDESNPTKLSTEYSALIPVSSTTTIKAISHDGADSSNVATAVYNLVTPVDVSTISQLRAGAQDGTVYRLANEAIVTALNSNRNQKFIQDNTGAILIDDSPGVITSTYGVGDGIENLIGKLNEYNGLLQFQPVAEGTQVSPGSYTISPASITLSVLTGASENYESQLVSIQATSFDDAGSVFTSFSDYNISDATNNFNFYTFFGAADYIGGIIPGTTDLTGVITQSGSNYRISARDLNDFNTIANPAPVISNILFSPSNPDTTENIVITANVTDELLVVSVELYYGTSAGDLNQMLAMLNTGGNEYSATIPAQKVGEIYFALKAKDNGNAISSSLEQNIFVSAPPLAIPLATLATVIKNEEFTANWNLVPGASEYLVDVSTEPDFEGSSLINENGLIISEVVEGSSYNKAIEIFNGTGKPVDLSDYKVQRDDNGDNNFSIELELTGFLENGETFVVCHPSASSLIKRNANIENTICGFNGNDQIRLVKNGITVDFFGRSGDVEFNKDHTFVRYKNISKANSAFKALEWKKYKKDSFGFLGFHEMEDAIPSVFVNNYFRFSAGNNKSLIIEDLYALSDYYYRVRAKSEYETTNVSNVIKVKTANPPLAYFKIQTDTICEDTLHNSRVDFNLVFTQFKDGLLPASSFTLKNAPPGVKVEKVIYKNSTLATLVFNFKNADFDTDFQNVSIVINGEEITRNYPLESNSFYLKSLVEIILPEPTNPVSNLNVVTERITQTSFDLTWTKSIEGNLPEGYLIIVDTAQITVPVDGVDLFDEDLNLTDGFGIIKVPADTNSYSFVNCSPTTLYNIAVFPFANMLADIDFKTDSFATLTVKTLTPPLAEIPIAIWYEPFDSTLNSMTPFNSVGDTTWSWASFGNPVGCAQINAYSDGENEDWLISPELYLQGFKNLQFSFSQARNYGSNEGLSVLVSSDYDGTSNPSEQGNWTDLTNQFSFPETGSWSFIDAGKIDFSEFALTNVFIAFKYVCGNENIPAWEIDNVLVSGLVGIDSVETPVFSSVAGIIEKNTEITITTNTAGATIYYTTDGTIPDTSSRVYTNPLVITETTILTAIAAVDTILSKVAVAEFIVEIIYMEIPQAPLALDALNLTSTSFTATWGSSVYASNYFIDVASDSLFTENTGTTTTSLFISEYIEGGSFNKAIEIYNGTTETVDLSAYKLQKDVNGDNDFDTEITLSGELLSGDIFVVCHTSASEDIKAVADLQNGSVINFNGNDQVRLVKLDNTVVDHFGTAGGDDFAKDATLVRLPEITSGNAIWNKTEWTSYEKDDISNLGTHLVNKSVVADSFVPGYKNLEVGDTTLLELTNLPQKIYFYRVRAANELGTSENSNIIKVELLNEPIIEVSKLSELRSGEFGATYKFTGEAVVTFSQSFRNQKFIQDSTAAILIDDPNGIITAAYYEGDGITNLTGELTSYLGMLEFTPEINPEEPFASNLPIDTLFIDWLDLVDSTFFEKNEARLVKIPNLVFDIEDDMVFENGTIYDFNQVWLTSATTDEFKLKFRTTFYDVDYIGTEITFQFLEITGLLNDRDGAFLTSRRLSDIEVGNGGSALEFDRKNNINIFGDKHKVIIQSKISENSKVDIHNLGGQLIYSGKYYDTRVEIPVTRQGVYIVKYKTAGIVKVEKVFVN